MSPPLARNSTKSAILSARTMQRLRINVNVAWYGNLASSAKWSKGLGSSNDDDPLGIFSPLSEGRSWIF
jgi:hypothetical protein